MTKSQERELIGKTVQVDAHEYTIQGVGIVLEDQVFLHMASTTLKRQQKNGLVPQQTGQFVSLDLVRNLLS